jgi:hypothetical protein
MMTRAELDRVFNNNTAMKKRCVVPCSFLHQGRCIVYFFVLLHRTHGFVIVSSLFETRTRRLFCPERAYGVQGGKEDNNCPKIVRVSPLSFCLCLLALRLWKCLSNRQTGRGDYSLGMPETFDAHLTIPHMESDHRYRGVRRSA